MTASKPSWHKVLGLMTAVSSRSNSTTSGDNPPERFASGYMIPLEKNRPFGMVASFAEARDTLERS